MIKEKTKEMKTNIELIMPALMLLNFFEEKPVIAELKTSKIGILINKFSIIFYPFNLLIKLISKEFLALNKDTIIAKPIADSAAATARIKKTKT